MIRISRDCLILSRYGSSRCLSSVQAKQKSVSAAIQVDEHSSPESLYPPIKPEFPPGRWGGFNRHTAWMFHNSAQMLQKIPSVKLRLEFMAGDVDRSLWLLKPFDKRPKNLDFRRFITRTHLVNGLPEKYKNIDTADVYNSIKSDISEIISQELWLTRKAKAEPNEEGVVFVDAQKYTTHRMFGGILQYLRAYLSKSTPHLLTSQLDENVRVETFWKVAGFKDKCKGKHSHVFDEEGSNAGMIVLQFKDKPCWQIRTEQPLPEIVALEDTLCRLRELPLGTTDYTPGAAGLPCIKEKPISVSGHWVGAPCEWTALSVHALPTQEYSDLCRLGEQYSQEAELGFGLAAGFGSCVAQAHNQGFCHLFDTTYPISTQCLVTDGRWMRVFVYQLNTLQLWKEYSDRGNPLCNLVWASDPLPLFEVEGRRVKSLNEEAMNLLIKCLMVQPAPREGVNMRPYLDPNSGLDEPAPLDVNKYINNKGEEPIQRQKIGRFQYPKDSEYFRS